MQNTPIDILNEFFEFSEFRSGQLEIIDAVMKYDNVLAVLPTGAGKSLCYQIPALLSENFSIVVSPLIALMKDQVDTLNRKQEVAAFINSTMDYSETEEVLSKIAFGTIKLLYLAPERIDTLKFAERIKSLKPKNIFIDEAHCISEWGHNFRPSYLKIKDFIEHISIKKVSAFTATATPEVRDDIIEQLSFKDPKIFVRGFERDNLHLRVIHTKRKKEKCFDLIREIGGPAIIYTSSRKKAEEAADYLNLKGIKCNYYHAGLPSPERRRVQEDFLQGATEIISATNAFGMGIDKSNIRLVIHYNTPGSIESYYQETGRAGRDGKESYCYLLYDESDMAIQNFFISNSHPNKEQIQNVYKAVCDYNRIAVGSATDKELIVDREYISKYSGTEISSGLLHSAIKYLENSGYLTRISEFDKKDSLQILISKEQLRRFMQSTSNNELVNLLVEILREFGSNIFIEPIKFSIPQISSMISTPTQTIIELLTILENMGVISFQQAISKDTVKLTAPRVEVANLILNYKLINESYLNSLRKLDKMNEYIFSNDCRFKNILYYFGENVPDYKCGRCDNCTSTGRLSDSSSSYLSEIILDTIEEAKNEVPENFLVGLLRGEKLKESATLFRHYGTCKKYSRAEIKGVISQLISKEKLIKRFGNKNYLSLPKVETFEKIFSEKEDENRTNSYNEDLYLYNQLREVRKKASEKFMQSGYLICPDNVLKEVARVKPKTKSELIGINGFNSRMFNKLGTDFLEVINSYNPQKNQSGIKNKENTMPSDILETKKLIWKRYKLNEIAEARKLTEAVISMQIETIVEYDPDINISFLIREDTMNAIFTEAKKGYKNLKELKERLPSKITYPEIRIAIAKFKAESQRSI